MKQTPEVTYCKNFFQTAGRSKVMATIEESNLTDRERELINARYIVGMQIKEICSKFGMEEEAYKKLQKKILIKFYRFMTA